VVVPTPLKAARIRETTIANILKRHRIRRFDAAQVLDTLRKPPVQVAAGTIEAASAHIATLIARIRLVNRQLKDAHQRLDILTARLIPTADTEPGQRKQHDVEILASLPGVGRTVLATLLAEAFDALQRRDYAALRSLTGVAPVTKWSGKSCIVIRRLLGNAMDRWARCCRPTWHQEQGQIHRSQEPRAKSWSRAAIGRRSPPQCRLCDP
jgi:transposase